MSIRWLLLVLIEVYAWAGTVAFVVLRYRFDRRRASERLLASILALEAGLLVIGIADWLRTGTWTVYQTVIVAILGYAAVRGKRDLRRLDAWAARRLPRAARQRRGAPASERC
jgi:hypothetical protein